MGLTAVVENIRLSKVFIVGHAKMPKAPVNMSMLRLLPQFYRDGYSFGVETLGQFGFYHREFPKTMSSIGNSSFFLSMAVANLLSTALFNIVNETTSRNEEPSWVADNLSKARFDYYCLPLGGFSLVNVLYYIVCIRS
ncbi:hypothetical protein F3Y22_tig00110556pilonHSYRG00570 [Hibiscus syriacus]|uniref:Uncharacterized protein n=1 Tax=Hibiscus syriacus TaxID=106335 RepID=A0A6A3A9T1_HIBSY|nr:hypothetical protein F3Y22_tig00110556pilonHSYRG00570 [Hibiscus syriacus]